MAFAEQKAAYVLHSRPYRDTSLLVDFLTLEHGKVSAVVKGARRPNSRLRSSIQPFVPLQITWRGRHELKSLLTAEPVAPSLLLQGNALLCGLYVNELLERLMLPFDSHPQLYVFYQYVLNELKSADDIEGGLRTFEHRLLAELGFLPDLSRFDPEQIYCLESDQGFVPCFVVSEAEKKVCFYGRQLMAIAEDDYNDPQVKRAAKRLMRLLIDRSLGHKPLRSRELFQKM
ncbi:MAG: DNA repair protein RecO [Neptuniibacter sp.]